MKKILKIASWAVILTTLAWLAYLMVVETRFSIYVGNSEKVAFLKEWPEEGPPVFCLKLQIDPKICLEIGETYGIEKIIWDGKEYSYEIVYYRIRHLVVHEISEERASGEEISGILILTEDLGKLIWAEE